MKKYAALCLIVSIAVPAMAFAQTQPQSPSATNPCNAATSIGQCVSRIYIWALAAAALLALLYMIFGGYLVMTAAGNAQQRSKGIDYINSSLIGVALLLSAYLILNTINPDLVDFTIPAFDNPRQ